MSIRVHFWLFTACTVLLSWYAMMAVHELGHVLGALLTGGTVTHVVLHPLAISRTDVQPNPHPAVVVWMGPVIGCLLPVLLFLVTPPRYVVWRTVIGFFSGFCLIANGVYIGVGAWDEVGDCREMLQSGTPLWVMLLFGASSAIAGLVVWHRLGAVSKLVKAPPRIPLRWTCAVGAALIMFLVAGCLLSSRQ